MIIWNADTLGNPANCLYPNFMAVSSEESLKEAVSRDYVCAEYRENRRSVSSFIRSDCLPMDCDNDHSDREEDWITPDEIRLLFPDVTLGVHYSRNHMKQKGERSPRPRFHILFAISPCEDAAAYKALKEQVHARCPFFDGNALDAARFMFGTEKPQVGWFPGSMTLDMFLIRQGQEDDIPEPNASGTIPEGKRNQTMSVYAARLLKRLGNKEETLKKYYERAAMCRPPLPGSELKSIWVSACRFYTKIRRLESYISPEDYVEKGTLRPRYPNDLAEARILASEYGDRLRFSTATQFLVFDGRVWKESNELATGLVAELTERQLEEQAPSLSGAREMKKDADQAIREAAVSGSPADEARAKKAEARFRLEEAKRASRSEEQYYAFLMACGTYSHVSSILNLVKPMVLIDASDLDAYPYLLNTPAGEVDLRTGEILPHDPKHYHTKMTRFSPSEENMDQWLEHIREVTCGDETLARYFQLTSGEELLGTVRNECLRIEIGSGANGKSTYTNTKLRVLGSYGGQLSAETLTVQNRYQKNWEIGELRGKRLIVAGELEEGQRLNDAFVKKICSSDAILGEKKFKDLFQFIPSHTVVLYTNHLPRVRSRDHGIWRRLKVIPFRAELSGSGKFKNYTEYLTEHCGGAVLKWMIDGAREFIANGYEIEDPPCVKQAIAEYRQESDWLAPFLNECCSTDSSAEVKSYELYQQYRDFSAARGERPKSTNEFGSALQQAGFQRKHTRAGNVFCGLSVRGEFIPVDVELPDFGDRQRV